MARTNLIAVLIKNISEGTLRNRNEVCLRIYVDASIEDTTNIVFVVGHKLVCLI